MFNIFMQTIERNGKPKNKIGISEYRITIAPMRVIRNGDSRIPHNCIVCAEHSENIRNIAFYARISMKQLLFVVH